MFIKLRRLTKRPEKDRDNAPDAGDCPEGVHTSQAVFYALAFFPGLFRPGQAGWLRQHIGKFPSPLLVITRSQTCYDSSPNRLRLVAQQVMTRPPTGYDSFPNR